MSGSAIPLQPHERDELLEAIPFVSPMPARDQLIFRLSFFNGMRRCEIAGLAIDSMLGPRGQILNVIRIFPETTKKKGARTIEMHPEVRQALEEFLDVYPTAEWVAISSRDGKRMTPEALGRAMERIYEAAGFSGCRSHTGRASCITEMASLVNNYGCTLADVQRFAGHQRLDTTAIYLGSTGRMRNLVEAVGTSNRNERRAHNEPTSSYRNQSSAASRGSIARGTSRQAAAGESHADSDGRRDEERYAVRTEAKRRARRKLRQNRPFRRDR